MGDPVFILTNSIFLRPPVKTEYHKQKWQLTLFSVGYFLCTESVGGGHICPPIYFREHFFGAPLKFKFFAICFIGLMGSHDILGKSKEVMGRSFERKGAIGGIFHLVGNIHWIGLRTQSMLYLVTTFCLHQSLWFIVEIITLDNFSINKTGIYLVYDKIEKRENQEGKE